MIFLLVYSRRSRELRCFKQYPDSEFERAEYDRLQAELDAATEGDIESLLLRATDEAAVRSSHARYFENASSLLRDLRNGA
ncbi:MAG: hypothetical protein M3N13_08450 [Candidatus Eremiobacteraeota bacterium]|nr:hypothetical protein [Candidatus Eremiobacteraeota bacterium]